MRCYFGSGGAPTPQAAPEAPAPIATPPTPASQPAAGTQEQAAQRLYVADTQGGQSLGGTVPNANKTSVKTILGG